MQMNKLANCYTSFWYASVPGNQFWVATPLQPRPALHAFYHHDTEANTCMKTKIIVIYCNTPYYTYLYTLYYNAYYGPSSTRILLIVLATGKFVSMRNILSKITVYYNYTMLIFVSCTTL